MEEKKKRERLLTNRNFHKQMPDKLSNLIVLQPRKYVQFYKW